MSVKNGTMASELQVCLSVTQGAGQSKSRVPFALAKDGTAVVLCLRAQEETDSAVSFVLTMGETEITFPFHPWVTDRLKKKVLPAPVPSPASASPATALSDAKVPTKVLDGATWPSIQVPLPGSDKKTAAARPKWPCSACTYDNLWSAQTCEMCSQSKTVLQRRSAIDSGGPLASHMDTGDDSDGEPSDVDIPDERERSKVAASVSVSATETKKEDLSRAVAGGGTGVYKAARCLYACDFGIECLIEGCEKVHGVPDPRQIAYLEQQKAGENTRAGLVSCVPALSGRCRHMEDGKCSYRHYTQMRELSDAQMMELQVFDAGKHVQEDDEEGRRICPQNRACMNRARCRLVHGVFDHSQQAAWGHHKPPRHYFIYACKFFPNCLKGVQCTYRHLHKNS